VLLSDVDGLYTAAPDTPGAERIDDVRVPEDVAGVDVSRRGSALGTGGMITKLEAASLATASGVAVVLASADDVADAIAGRHVGTLFHITGKRDTTRLQWLAHVAKIRGGFVLDDGAVRAVKGRKASLLAAGVIEVHGTFEAGEPVELLTRGGVAVARGFAGFSAEDATRMKGLSTDALRDKLGETFAHALIHIDDLVVL
jgi:glutamate 5-kinase